MTMSLMLLLTVAVLTNWFILCSARRLASQPRRGRISGVWGVRTSPASILSRRYPVTISHPALSRNVTYFEPFLLTLLLTSTWAGMVVK